MINWEPRCLLKENDACSNTHLEVVKPPPGKDWGHDCDLVKIKTQRMPKEDSMEAGTHGLALVPRALQATDPIQGYTGAIRHSAILCANLGAGAQSELTWALSEVRNRTPSASTVQDQLTKRHDMTVKSTKRRGC